MLKKNDLIERMVERGYSKSASSKFMNDFVHVLMEAMVSGEEIMLHGFGTFSTKEVMARASKDVRTMEDIIIPSHREVRFACGGELKRAIREGIVRE